MRIKPILVALFGVSGATGLLYESIWTQYLGLFLGHTAYAQSLVLMLFMGGLSLGAYLTGRYSQCISKPLVIYALIEILVGVSALVFHLLYLQSTDLYFEQWLPSINHLQLITFSKWLVAALLVFPQTILLGATFPLMVAGLDRLSEQSTGYSTAGVYFINSLGAAIGVLITGFYLAPKLGLPTTMTLAGIVNCAIGLVALLLSRFTANAPALPGTGKLNPGWLFLLVAAVTGTASFIYEIGWIRMLSLVLGSSSHAFELMLSAFISGLAIGGFLIRRRIERIRNPKRTLGLVQLFMGALAALTIAFYDQTFVAMQFFIKGLSQSDQGYVIFNVLCHGLTFAFMLPVTICAGMTLPLLTQCLVDEGHGEASVGKIYSANTLGSLVGVLLALHLLMPIFGLKALICIGAAADLALGWWLITGVTDTKRRPLATAAVASGIWLAVVMFVQPDPIKMASGVYLFGKINTSREILFHQDGKTASVDVIRNGDHLAIATNGKVDAAVNDKSPSKDEPTMLLLGALSQAIKPDIKTAAIIGFGSGITSNSLLASTTLERLDTVEIEPAMIAGAKLFGDRVAQVFEDPRSHIVVEDAKTYFSNHKVQYDLIISEPSNPWISGIASLFSVEHYQVMRRHLKPDGIFVQWLQIYGMNPETVASVMKALEQSFPHYTLYALNNTDLGIIAQVSKPVAQPSAHIFNNQQLQKDLRRIGVKSTSDLFHRRIGSEKLLSPYFNSFDIAANSDFHGVLAPAAVKARYQGENALELQRFRLVPAALSQIIEGFNWPVDPDTLAANIHLHSVDLTRKAIKVRNHLLNGRRPTFKDSELRSALLFVDSQSCRNRPQTFIFSIQDIAAATLPFLSEADNVALWQAVVMSNCAASLSQNPNTRQWLHLFSEVSKGNYHKALAKFDSSQRMPAQWRNNLTMYQLINAYKNGAKPPKMTRERTPELQLLRAHLNQQ